MLLRPENIGNGARDILILAGDETRRGLDDGHFASEAAIELRKFEADIAAAEHDQMRGQKIDVHHRAVGQIGDLVEARDRWNQGPSAYIDEDLIGPEHLIGDLDLLRSDKPGVALIDRASLQRLQGSLDGRARHASDGILARLHRLHVDAHRPAEGHAIFGGTACKMRRIAARDQRFGRGAASIDAGTAEKFALDDRDFPACSHQPSRQGGTRLSGADDDRIIIRHDRPPVSPVATAGTIDSTRARRTAACRNARLDDEIGSRRSWTLRVV